MMKSVKEVNISADMIKKIEKLKDGGPKPFTLSEEQKTIIMEYYYKKDKRELARLLGMSEATLRRHHKDLINDRPK
jgi:DNA-directed RNA polymerase specialized sigma subunit